MIFQVRPFRNTILFFTSLTFAASQSLSASDMTTLFCVFDTALQKTGESFPISSFDGVIVLNEEEVLNTNQLCSNGGDFINELTKRK